MVLTFSLYHSFNFIVIFYKSMYTSIYHIIVMTVYINHIEKAFPISSLLDRRVFQE